MKIRVATILAVLSLNICVLIGKDRVEDTQWTLGQYYEPYELKIEPNAPGYALPLDIKDIVNFNEVSQIIDINSVSNLIRQNGFAIVEPGVYSDLSCHDFDTLYQKLGRFKIPAFVTVDTGLYLYHAVLDEVIEGIEDPALRTRIYDLKNQPFTVGKYGRDAYVRGLYLTALLGSDEALKILTDEVNADYERYGLESDKLKDEFNALSRVDWHANLYWSWLYSLRALLQELPKGYPEFMRTQAWGQRQLHAGLASWTQLHADSIRQPYLTRAKGSTPIAVTRPPVKRRPPLGYVEPNLVFWGRLLSLTRMASKGLDDLGVLMPEAQGRLSLLEELIHRTLEMAEMQLSNEPPSSEDREFFEKLESTLRKLLAGVQEQGLATILAGDAMGLEQAVGDIDLIIVACPTSDGNARLAIGPVLSYYEFKRPNRDRLTDETWRLMLDSPAKPDRPQWYDPLISPREDFSGLTRLTHNLSDDKHPCWSPDGKKIAFVGKDRDSNLDIFVMNADGTGKKNLTNNPGRYLSLRWSPDGKKIAFQLGGYDKYAIYVMNTDGSEQIRLTNNRANDGGPCWSPDGKRIVFWSDRNGQKEIYIMNADGSEEKRVTNNSAYDGSPCWSPDGKKIVFTSDRDKKYINQVYIINADGSEEKKITNNFGYDGNPCWSPDGKKIAFVSDRDGNNEIYVMKADGSDQRRLTNNSANDDNPCWSPDGRQIVFDSSIGISGFPEICIMNIKKETQY